MTLRRVGLWVLGAALLVALVIGLADPLGGPEPAVVRIGVVLLLEGLIAFSVLGIRRLIVDARVVDDHPDEEFPLIHDRAGKPLGLGLPSPPGFEKGLEAMAKDLDDPKS